MSKGRLSDIEKHYIASNPDNLSVGDMAKKLGRAENTVRKMMDTNKAKAEPKENITEVKEEETVEGPYHNPDEHKKSSVDKARFGHRRGATVMTPVASELLDESRKDFVSRHAKAAIHKPMGDK
jgi:hypothetical protein